MAKKKAPKRRAKPKPKVKAPDKPKEPEISPAGVTPDKGSVPITEWQGKALKAADELRHLKASRCVQRAKAADDDFNRVQAEFAAELQGVLQAQGVELPKEAVMRYDEKANAVAWTMPPKAAKA